MVQVTATEMKTSFGKYLDINFLEDIEITKNGKTVAFLIKPRQEEPWFLKDYGIADNPDFDLNQLKEERIFNKHVRTVGH